MHVHISCSSFWSFLLILVGSTFLFSQNHPPASNPQAVSFASQSVTALTGGKAINDVTLTGSVTWSGGAAPKTGTATLLASGTGESRTSSVVPSGTRTEIRDASTGTPRELDRPEWCIRPVRLPQLRDRCGLVFSGTRVSCGGFQRCPYLRWPRDSQRGSRSTYSVLPVPV